MRRATSLLRTRSDENTLEKILFFLQCRLVLGMSNKRCGTSLVKFLYGSTTTDDVVAPVTVETFEFGVLKTVGN
jgi:hypothetical protein